MNELDALAATLRQGGNEIHVDPALGERAMIPRRLDQAPEGARRASGVEALAHLPDVLHALIQPRRHREIVLH